MPEKRKELIEIDRKELKKEEEILRKKYEINFDTINKNRQKNIMENLKEDNNNSLMQIPQEKWYKRILNKILIFFKIKR